MARLPALEAAEQELLAAIRPGPHWAVNEQYRRVIDGERTAASISSLGATGLSGVLRAPELVRATLITLRQGQTGRAKHQMRIMDARRNLVDERVRAGELSLRMIVPDTALLECRGLPGTLEPQRRRIDQAIQNGYDIRVVPSSVLQDTLDPEDVCSLVIRGVGGREPDGVYVQTDVPEPDMPHEMWLPDRLAVTTYTAVHATLAALSEPLTSAAQLMS